MIKLIYSARATGFLTLIIVVMGSCSGKKDAGSESVRQPNVVVVLADQWRAQATGYAGDVNAKSPNLDNLAKQSVVFSTAVSVQPVCTPYRASLITGQFPLTHGLFYNDKPLPKEALTIAEIYKSAGYATGYIGKWHLNGHPIDEGISFGRNRPVPADARQGFDYWKVRETTHDYNNSYYFDENNDKHVWPGYDAFPQTDSAISFVNKNKEKPFLLFLSWGSPHDPYHTAPEEYRKLFDPATVALRPNVPTHLQDSARKILAGYYAHCAALDTALGKLLAALDDTGLTDNTIFVFTSDHGDMLLSRGETNKQKPWDESLLVPMVLRYPALLGMKGKEIAAPINTPDILPTLLALSGIEIPHTVEGRTFTKAELLGEEPLQNEAAFIQAPVPFHQWNFEKGGREYRAIRTERYTYARDRSGPWLLYDNVNDPYQQDNLIGKAEHVALQSRMEEILTDKLKQRSDNFVPADEYMKQWKYRYDNRDSVRIPSR